MRRHAFRSLIIALGLPLLGAGLASGCAKQGEGEPCDFDGRSDDCESGLVCTAGNRLRRDAQDRCCPVSGPISDERCTLGGGGAGGTGGTAGTGGTGAAGDDGGDAAGGDASEDAPVGDGAGGDGASGAAGSAGVAGTGGDDGGAEACAEPCNFNSECTSPLVCGPQGCCQPECRESIDCESSEQCVAGVCEPVVPDAGSD